MTITEKLKDCIVDAGTLPSHQSVVKWTDVMEAIALLKNEELTSEDSTELPPHFIE